MTEPTNSAIVPDPPQPQERSYAVTGVQGYLDYRPGEQFTATLPFDQEDLLLQAGVLKVLDEPSAPVEPASEPQTPAADAAEPKPHQRPHRSRHTPSRPETTPSPDPADQE